MTRLPAGAQAIRVLLVDDDDMVRNGLRAALGTEAAIEVVGTAREIGAALSMAARLQPGLIVTELQLEGRSAVELLEGLRQMRSTARVLVLTSVANEFEMRKVMAAGASAYLMKEDGYSELLEALRVVNAGRRFFSDSVESTVLSQYAERVATRFAVAAAPITPREREVLARIGQGQTNKAIARALHLSVKTVEKHRSNLMRKLGLHNTAAVTVYAIRQGLVSQEDAAGAAR